MLIMTWCTTVYYPRYEQPNSNSAFGWDAGGYYWYLPSIFIYHDLGKQRWADSILNKYNLGGHGADAQGFRASNGNIVMKYPAGLAVLEMPFFFVAHMVAEGLGYPRDGFSKPYQVAVQIGGLLIAFIGLAGLRRLLKYYFSDIIVAVTLLILVIGTNYLNYSTTDNTIAHSWLFTLYVLLLLSTRAFYTRPNSSNSLKIGLLCGLATLVRPTDLIACIIPIFWGLRSIDKKNLFAHFGFLWKLRGRLILAACAAMAVIAIQIVYWKLISGSWIVYSYQDQGFNFLHPHIFNYTFSYRSGWVTYTPIVLLAIVGIIPTLRRGRNGIMVILFLGTAYYIVAAWDIWWYAGMGGRAMVQYYPVLCLLIAAGMEWLSKRRSTLVISIPFILAFSWVNVWFMYHAHAGSLYDSEGGMTKEYFWRVIGRFNVSGETTKLKDGKYLFDGPTPPGAKLLYHNTLHQSASDGKDSVLIMNGNTKSSAEYRFAKPEGRFKWLRASAVFYSVTSEPATWNMLQFYLGTYKIGGKGDETMMRVQRWINAGERHELWVDFMPPAIDTYDSIQIHFWNVESNAETQVEDLKVWGW